MTDTSFDYSTRNADDPRVLRVVVAAIAEPARYPEPTDTEAWRAIVDYALATASSPDVTTVNKARQLLNMASQYKIDIADRVPTAASALVTMVIDKMQRTHSVPPNALEAIGHLLANQGHHINEEAIAEIHALIQSCNEDELSGRASFALLKICNWVATNVEDDTKRADAVLKMFSLAQDHTRHEGQYVSADALVDSAKQFGLIVELSSRGALNPIQVNAFFTALSDSGESEQPDIRKAAAIAMGTILANSAKHHDWLDHVLATETMDDLKGKANDGQVPVRMEALAQVFRIAKTYREGSLFDDAVDELIVHIQDEQESVAIECINHMVTLFAEKCALDERDGLVDELENLYQRTENGLLQSAIISAVSVMGIQAAPPGDSDLPLAERAVDWLIEQTMQTSDPKIAVPAMQGLLAWSQRSETWAFIPSNYVPIALRATTIHGHEGLSSTAGDLAMKLVETDKFAAFLKGDVNAATRYGVLVDALKLAHDRNQGARVQVQVGLVLESLRTEQLLEIAAQNIERSVVFELCSIAFRRQREQLVAPQETGIAPKNLTDA